MNKNHEKTCTMPEGHFGKCFPWETTTDPSTDWDEKLRSAIYTHSATTEDAGELLKIVYEFLSRKEEEAYRRGKNDAIEGIARSYHRDPEGTAESFTHPKQ